MLKTEILPSFYQDSVVLMRVAAEFRGKEGVREIALFMGTPLNHAVLEQAGLLSAEAKTAGPNDLIIAVDGSDEAVCNLAIARSKEMLLAKQKTQSGAQERQPRSLEAALQAMPEANVLSLSVAGAYVRTEAMAALKRGLHLFIFSDNVSVEDEIAMKEEALSRRLLCMGPDQGTAYLNGVGLGFANIVKPGKIGCIAASGTGLQTVMAHSDAKEAGISQAIGVGGRDLSEKVGGIMTFLALEALEADPKTDLIILISKPLHASVLPKLKAKLASLTKPVVVCCIGEKPANEGRIVWVDTLDQASDAALALLAQKPWQPARLSDEKTVFSALKGATPCENKAILGLYTGGTLAYEATYLFKSTLGEHPHRILDLGDDEYTVGRPHPMIDPSLRNEMIAKAGGDGQVGVLLLDLVLGLGAHENPAEPMAKAVMAAQSAAKASGRTLHVLAYILGTKGDRQGLLRQSTLLKEAGIHLFASNADAVKAAMMLTRPSLQKEWLKGDAL